MAMRGDRKLYLGPRLRTLRRELGLNQTRMAEELGVSPSYLNHLERNQRPLTAQMLLRLADAYDVDMRSFVAAANEATSSDLHEILADELVRDIGIPRQEVLEVAENYPSVAEAVTRLYRALQDLRQVPDRLNSAGSATARIASPLAWLREWLDARRSYFPEIDSAAEALAGELGGDADTLYERLKARLIEKHRIGVRVVPLDVLPDALSHYDYHRRRLLLSETIPPASRLFELGHRLAIEELSEPVTAVVTAAEPPDAEARAVAQRLLFNYAAAAILMPYARFHAAAEAGRYDLDLLTARFGVSYEQAAHRLTTLNQPGARGVPLFLLKVDVAGNVAKRFAGDGMPLAAFGGGCPRWRVHRAFRRIGETVVDTAEMPDGSAYLTWARAIVRQDAEPIAIILGCEAKYAERIGYGDAGGAPTPIGPACHLCERIECADRSLPPLTRPLMFNAMRRSRSPYPFRSA